MPRIFHTGQPTTVACIASFALVLVTLSGIMTVPAAAQDRIGQSATSGGLLDRVLAEAPRHDGVGYAYRMRMFVLAEDEEETLISRFDPSLPAGDRWKMIDREGEETGEGGQVQFSDDEDPNGGLPDYAEMAHGLKPADAVLTSETESEAVYSVARGIPAYLDDDMSRFSDYLQSELVIEKTGANAPYIRQIRLHAPESFKPAVIATMRRLEVVVSFAPQGERGDILPTALDLQVEGTALWIDFGTTTDIRYDQYRYVGKPAEAGGEARSD